MNKSEYLRDWNAKNPEYRKAYHKQWYAANPEYVWRRVLADRYGITSEQYEEMVRAQGGRCAICGTDNPGRKRTKWAVDHCHKTGRVRGLLCTKCNPGLGYFQDSPELLLAAARYLA